MKRITRNVGGYRVSIKAYNDRIEQVNSIDVKVPFKKLNAECHDYILDVITYVLGWRSDETTIIKVDFIEPAIIELSIPLFFSVVNTYASNLF